MNQLIYVLAGFVIIAILTYFLAKNQYVKEKALWWIYIILFFIFLLLDKYTLIAGLAILNGLAIFEFFRNLKRKGFTNLQRVIFGIIFLALLVGFDYFVFYFTNYFIYLFILISFSDIIAYFVWKWFPWKKWFTKLSPNKSLSGVLAQIVFIFVVILIFWNKFLQTNILILLAFFISILAPIGDLTESYFKRKTGEKDMAYYIPGHWWVLDRIDSSFLSVGIIGLVIMIMQCYF